MTPGPGIKPGTHWWKAGALTTAPTLVPENNTSFRPSAIINSDLLKDTLKIVTRAVERFNEMSESRIKCSMNVCQPFKTYIVLEA